MEEKHEKKFDGVFLRRWLWDYKGTNEKIGWTEKIVFSMIDLLDKDREGCFASNDYLAKNMDVSKDRISKIITKLNRDGLINVKLVRNEKNEVEKRIITVNLQRVIELEYPQAYRQTQLDPIGKDAYTLSVNTPTINSTLNNNINNNNKETQEQLLPKENINKEIIEYFNLKANKKILVKAKGTNSLINKLLKVGYKKEDFFKVIDTKVDHWSGIEDKERYLTPQTLFAESNFEKYLLQTPYRFVNKELKSKIKTTVTKSINQYYLFNAGEE